MFLTTLDRTHDASFRGFGQFLSATLNPRHTPGPGPCRRPQLCTDFGGPGAKLARPAGPLRGLSWAHRPSLRSLRPPGKNTLPGLTSRCLQKAQPGVGGRGAEPGASTRGCPSSTKPTGATLAGARWHSQAQGWPFPHGVWGWTEGDSSPRDALLRVLSVGPGFVVGRVSGTFQRHLPLHSTPSALCRRGLSAY